MTETVDVVVIGMGPGGEEVAGKLAEAGLSVVGISLGSVNTYIAYEPTAAYHQANGDWHLHADFHVNIFSIAGINGVADMYSRGVSSSSKVAPRPRITVMNRSVYSLIVTIGANCLP